VWKEHKLLKRIDRETAAEFVEILSRLFEAVRVLSVRGSEGEIFDLASKEGLTVYDASYLWVAAERGLVLVTDDRRLREVGAKYVKVLSSRELDRSGAAPVSARY